MNDINIDLAQWSIQELGQLTESDVFPPGYVILPDLQGGILDELERSRHLGWQYVFVYHYPETPHQYEFWQCGFCGFWCYLFDQDLMNTHLLCHCKEVVQRFLHDHVKSML